ncbi:MAG: hypothetical protein AMXMBFR20_28960 [Planctomycetia bacterium]
MKRSKSAILKHACLAVLSLVTLSGTSCPIPSIGLTCSNSLDGTAFGFLLTVPAEFTCTTAIPFPQLFVSVRYKQSTTGFIASITVSPTLDQSTSSSDVTVTDLGAYTNPNGVTFQQSKIVVSSSSAYSYIATATLPSGNVLGITVAGLSDDPALLTILTAILDTVQFT